MSIGTSIIGMIVFYWLGALTVVFVNRKNSKAGERVSKAARDAAYRPTRETMDALRQAIAREGL